MNTYTLITQIENADSCSYYNFKGSFKQAKLKVIELATKEHIIYVMDVTYWIIKNDKQLVTGSITIKSDIDKK